MIAENMKRIRKQKGISQEDLADALHVVRQTISKWEKGLSIPDAESVIRMAEILKVPVSELLGVQEEPARDLSEKLENANKWIAQKQHEERNRTLAGKKRGLILLLSTLALIGSLLFDNQLVSLIFLAGFTLSAVIVLLRNLPLLSHLTPDDPHMGVLKIVTLFDITICAAGVLTAVLIGFDIIPVQDDGRILAMLLVSGAMILSGIISPKLPFTRHTGLRLPWTIADQDTWNVAHQTLGFIALPTAVVYGAATLTIRNFRAVSLAAIVMWVGVPALVSYLYYYRKMHGAA